MPKSKYSKPVIVTTGKPMYKLTARALKALVAENKARVAEGNDPRVFVHGGELAQMRLEPYPRLQRLTPTKLKGLLDRAANFTRVKDNRTVPTRPPGDVVNDLLELQNWIGLPTIDTVIFAPAYTSNGVVHRLLGYNENARTFLAYSGPSIPDVPDSPSATALAAAVDLIVDELLGDFPFKTASDLANAVAMLLLPFVRQMVEGLTPLHVVSASTPGTGKTLLVHSAMSISQGDRIAAQAETRNDDEFRKRLTAIFAAGESVVFIDNLAKRIESGVLANAVTSRTWSDRILGGSTMGNFKNNLIWVVTANNPALSTEMARRSLRVRLISTEERPWEGRTFRHPHLDSWTRDHRGELIAACLTLVNAWLSEGRPRFSGEGLGGFEDWSDILGGILEVAGIRGFLANRDEFYNEIDEELAALRIFVEAWYTKFGKKRVGSKELLSLAREHDGSAFEFQSGNRSSQSTQLGKQLSNLRDRRIGDFQIKRAKNRSGAAQYYLERIPGEGGEGGEVVGTTQETGTASNLQEGTDSDLTTLTNPTNNDREGESE